jgi:hypothetical protein
VANSTSDFSIGQGNTGMTHGGFKTSMSESHALACTPEGCV